VTLNDKLAGQPGLVNDQPYADGWFFRVKLSQPGEVNALLSPQTYAAQLG
jgi:glycine cleavage system H protein